MGKLNASLAVSHIDNWIAIAFALNYISKLGKCLFYLGYF